MDNDRSTVARSSTLGNHVLSRFPSGFPREGVENIVIDRQILLQHTMMIQDLPKPEDPTGSSMGHQRTFSERMLNSFTKMVSRTDQKPRIMRAQLIRLHSSAKAIRESDLWPIHESPGSAEVSCRVLQAEEAGGNLLALHLTPIGESKKRMPFGGDGSTDAIIENFFSEGTPPASLVIETCSREIHLMPDEGEECVVAWAAAIAGEMGDPSGRPLLLGRKGSSIAMATRSTSDCSPRNGKARAPVAIAKKTNKIAMAHDTRSRSGAISESPYAVPPCDPPQGESKPLHPPPDQPSPSHPEKETERWVETHLGKAYVARFPPVTSEILTTRRPIFPRRGVTMPELFEPEEEPFHDHLPHAEMLPPDIGNMQFGMEAGGFNVRMSAMSTASSSPAVTPFGLHDRTLYGLAQAVERNPQLLNEDDREYRLRGIAVAFNIEQNRFRREVLDPRNTAHAALDKALFLVKDRLMSSEISDCAAQLSSALAFAGLHELAEVYGGLCQQEAAMLGFTYRCAAFVPDPYSCPVMPSMPAHHMQSSARPQPPPVVRRRQSAGPASKPPTMPKPQPKK